MWFVKQPQWYQVVVAPNMFGDIITDLGAMIQGGLGLAAGGNINPDGVSMFEQYMVLRQSTREKMYPILLLLY